MSSLKRFFLLFLFLVNFLNAIEFTQEELDFINENRKITIGLTEDPPFTYEEDGITKGYLKDLTTLLSQKSGLALTPQIRSWKENFKDFKEKKIEIAADLFFKEEREAYTLFSHPYTKLPIVVFSNKERVYKTHKDLKGLKVGVIMNTPFKKILEKIQGIEIIEYAEQNDQILSLSYGKIDVAIQTLQTGNYYINKNHITNIKILGGFGKTEETLHLGVQKNMPILHSIINKTIKSFTPLEWKELEKNFIVISKEKRTIALTETEMKFLETHPTITVATGGDWPPLDFVENGQATGFSIDYLKALSKIAGIKIKFVHHDTWDEMVESFQSGKVDMITAYPIYENDPQKPFYTEAFLYMFDSIFVQKGKEPLKTYKDLYGKKVAIVEGYNYEEYLPKHPQIEMVLVETSSEGVKKLSLGEVDAFLEYQAVGHYLLKQYNIQNVEVSGRVDFPETSKEDLDIRITVQENLPELFSIITKAMNNLTVEEKERIYNRWINIIQVETKDYTLLLQILGVAILIILIGIFITIKLNKTIKEHVKKYKEQESLLYHYAKQQSMGELVGNIAHQWRQPLTEISSQIMILETKRKLNIPIETNELDEYISKNNQILEHMSETIETFLNIYKKDSKEDSSFNIKEEIEKALLIISGTFLKKTIFINTKVESIDLIGNRGEFAQILLTLLHNCKDAAEESQEKEKRVSITAFKKEDKILLTIEDNLGGIKKDIHSIFNLNVTNKESGLGIGLYIAKNIIENKFNGTIEASNTDSGAKFTIVLNEV